MILCAHVLISGAYSLLGVFCFISNLPFVSAVFAVFVFLVLSGCFRCLVSLPRYPRGIPEMCRGLTGREVERERRVNNDC